MRAKEKANDIVQRFSKLEKGLDEKDWFSREVYFDHNNIASALICVDEILNALIDMDYIQYYKEVKKELINLKQKK
tara:strand:- start:981 stop:1208 length:228 start_codon:yes stop_codon:yes gene_type:complete